MKFSEVKLPSNRSFGLLFAFVFAAAALYFYWRGVASISRVLSVVSMGFFTLAFIAPRVLLPLNALWMRFGLLLGMIVSPIVLGVLFFGMFMPMAVIMRLARRDALNLKRRSVDSWWREREPPDGESFRMQF